MDNNSSPPLCGAQQQEITNTTGGKKTRTQDPYTKLSSYTMVSLHSFQKLKLIGSELNYVYQRQQYFKYIYIKYHGN